MDKKEVEKFLNIPLVIEEKIDGANLGISITKDYELVFQNRSKVITSATDAQWKALDSWVKQTPGIWEVLTTDDTILFGEWCYAKHSIGYSALPSYFVAFDIFIKSEKKFVSRAELERILEPTGIPIIRKLHAEFRANSLKDLTTLLETNSVYYDGKIEGIYIRVDDALWNLDRVKIVRPDFIQGIDTHWSKQILVKNTVKY